MKVKNLRNKFKKKKRELIRSIQIQDRLNKISLEDSNNKQKLQRNIKIKLKKQKKRVNTQIYKCFN